MIKINDLEKIYRTEEVETVALNKLSVEVKPENLLPSWDHPAVANQPCSTFSVCLMTPTAAVINSTILK